MHNTRPLYVRLVTDAERRVLEDSLRSPEVFVLRRAQIVLASAAGERAGQIAPRVGFSGQAVRNVIHSFHSRGLDILTRGSHHPGVVVSAFDAPRPGIAGSAAAEPAVLRQSNERVDPGTGRGGRL